MSLGIRWARKKSGLSVEGQLSYPLEPSGSFSVSLGLTDGGRGFHVAGLGMQFLGPQVIVSVRCEQRQCQVSDGGFGTRI